MKRAVRNATAWLLDREYRNVLVEVDNGDFGAEKAWFFVSLLTIGYMISRGLAKSGSRDYYDDETARY